MNEEEFAWLQYLPTRLRQFLRGSAVARKILANVGWLSFERIMTLGVRFFVGIWVVRFLGPDQFGTYSYAVSYSTIFSAVATLGLEKVVIQDLSDSDSPEDVNSILFSALILRLFAGVLVFAGVAAIIFSTEDSMMTQVAVLLVSLRLIIYAPEVFDYWFQARIQSKLPVYVRTAGVLVSSFLQVLCILFELSVISFLGALLINYVIIAVGLTVVFLWARTEPFRFTLGGKERILSLLSRSWPLIISGLSTLVYMKIDQVMLGRMVGTEEVGIYAAAARLSELWYFLPGALTASIYPEILRSLREDSTSRFQHKMQRLYDLLLILGIVVTVPVASLAAPMILILFGDEYTDSISVLQIHIWSFTFMSLGLAQGKRLVAENQNRLLMLISVVGALVNVGLNVALIPSLGAVGAAWATLVSYFVYGYGILALFESTRGAFKQMTYAITAPYRLLKERTQ